MKLIKKGVSQNSKVFYIGTATKRYPVSTPFFLTPAALLQNTYPTFRIHYFMEKRNATEILGGRRLEHKKTCRKRLANLPSKTLFIHT